jgi:hypothetical protein
MMASESRRLRARLRALGLSAEAIDAAWPRWWSTEADDSTSARAELAFSLARRFGLEPSSVIEGSDAPRFLWHMEARFKHRSNQSDLELAAITSFGKSVAAALLAATPPPNASIVDTSAGDLRVTILRAGRPYVELGDLLSVTWSVGVPVVHLRLYPLRQKRMAAMTVESGGRSAILIGKNSNYPAPIAFYLAHEIGHIALRHAAGDRLVVDFEATQRTIAGDDEEEKAADEFALELLTGRPRPDVRGIAPGRTSARELARVALRSGQRLGIEPGVLAECYGFTTGDWTAASGSLGHIYAQARPIWEDVNAIARRQLALDTIPPDSMEFLEAVLGPAPA